MLLLKIDARRIEHFSVSIICVYLFDIFDIWTIFTILIRWHSSVSFVELRSKSNFSLCTFYSFAHTHVVSSDSDVVQSSLAMSVLNAFIS